MNECVPFQICSLLVKPFQFGKHKLIKSVQPAHIKQAGMMIPYITNQGWCLHISARDPIDGMLNYKVVHDGHLSSSRSTMIIGHCIKAKWIG